MTDTEILEFFCAVLRDGASGWPVNATEETADRMLGLADLHGISSLLHAELGACETLPQPVRDGLRDRALGWAMHDLGERQVLGQLIEALVAHRVQPLIFKGAALAYSHYPDPALRQRADIDILVGPDEGAATMEALNDLGWHRASAMVAEVSSAEAPFSLDGPGDLVFHVDLHWRISGSFVLQRLFEHAELWRRSVSLPGLHIEARGLHPVDALLIACMHRLVHLRTPYYSDGVARYVPDRLIWLYDIRLLAEAFAAEEWEDLARRAREKGLAGICRESLLLARARLGARYPAAALAALGDVGPEPAAAYLCASWARREWMDFLAVEGVGAKLRFLSEAVLPPGDYMRARFGREGRGWLPWLYLRRAVGGLLKRARGRPDTVRLK